MQLPSWVADWCCNHFHRQRMVDAWLEGLECVVKTHQFCRVGGKALRAFGVGCAADTLRPQVIAVIVQADENVVAPWVLTAPTLVDEGSDTA